MKKESLMVNAAKLAITHQGNRTGRDTEIRGRGLFDIVSTTSLRDQERATLPPPHFTGGAKNNAVTASIVNYRGRSKSISGSAAGDN